jgi:hypothetical protein
VQFAQHDTDAGMVPIGVDPVLSHGLLGCEPYGCLADHVSVVRDESDFSLG